MNIAPSPVRRPLTGSAAARQKIDQALQLLEQTKTDNSELSDIFSQTEKGFEGYAPHIKAIEFDRPSKDVSSHGKALRDQADGILEELHEGGDELGSVKGNTAHMISLIEGAKVDLGQSNDTAAWRLDSAFNDLSFVHESCQPGIDTAYDGTTRLLTTKADPYLVEVEEDEPGRDVGRFADDLDEIFASAHNAVGSGPIYNRAAGRSFVSAEAYLKKAKEAL